MTPEPPKRAYVVTHGVTRNVDEAVVRLRRVADEAGVTLQFDGWLTHALFHYPLVASLALLALTWAALAGVSAAYVMLTWRPSETPHVLTQQPQGLGGWVGRVVESGDSPRPDTPGPPKSPRVSSGAPPGPRSR